MHILFIWLTTWAPSCFSEPITHSSLTFSPKEAANPFKTREKILQPAHSLQMKTHVHPPSLKVVKNNPFRSKRVATFQVINFIFPKETAPKSLRIRINHLIYKYAKGDMIQQII